MLKVLEKPISLMSSPRNLAYSWMVYPIKARTPSFIVHLYILHCFLISAKLKSSEMRALLFLKAGSGFFKQLFCKGIINVSKANSKIAIGEINVAKIFCH